MHRYFLEVAYKGTKFSGFQVQKNAVTIQSETEKALEIFYKQKIKLTGSSRTDAGVHAQQNYFHFDTNILIVDNDCYNLNALLPQDIVVKKIIQVISTAHCRFDALSREYQYFIYQFKDPFKYDNAWFYPYKFDLSVLNQAANMVAACKDFTSFAKRNTQVNNFICSIEYSQWIVKNDCLIYTIRGNRFLRGMVRGLVATMLKTGRKIITLHQFKEIMEAKDCTKADFKTPAHGLFLTAVNYPENIFRRV